ncbi:hypothetical protein GH714_039140 [Hevea brasiliensis]|uniref:Retrotransposon gag domain-containing protein n=1 Tax=Hevea brasiliensis TaxID=3981 RepID=A0A6A6KLV1_HEVBR|nr:hypothetical protein GH714_039140 [Hevea brasiliensis]
MEGRVDSVEKNITDLQQLVSAMKLEQEQCMSSFQAVQDQRFSRIESLLSSMALGKSTVQEVDPSLQSPTHGTSTVHPVTPPAIVDAVGTSTLYPATQPVVVNDSSLAIKKVELPNFDGVDPVAWLARAEQYFAINNTREEMKVQLALVCMEGPALHWLRWLRLRTPNLSWSQLTLELLHRYGGNMRINPYERLSTLRQDSSVDAYIDAFVALVSQIEGLSDQQYLGFFLSGLRDDIRVRIHSQDSTDIFRTMTLARELELENQFLLQSASQLKQWNDSGIRWSPPGFSPKLDMGKQSYGASVITKPSPFLVFLNYKSYQYKNLQTTTLLVQLSLPFFPQQRHHLGHLPPSLATGAPDTTPTKNS